MPLTYNHDREEIWVCETKKEPNIFRVDATTDTVKERLFFNTTMRANSIGGN